mmetsp:Transcript_11631/g.35873  ORF Transcript_11631/g.35873 Transcript_11631/m.35873 type:complete len:253 (+) Transcript_11631:204-962(+)
MRRVDFRNLRLEAFRQRAGLVEAVEQHQQPPRVARLLVETPSRRGGPEVRPDQRLRGRRIGELPRDVADAHEHGYQVRVRVGAHRPGQQLLREGRLAARGVAHDQQRLAGDVAPGHVSQRPSVFVGGLDVVGAVAVDSTHVARAVAVASSHEDPRAERDLGRKRRERVFERRRVRELLVAGFDVQPHALVHHVQVLSGNGVHDGPVVAVRRPPVTFALIIQERRRVPGLRGWYQRVARYVLCRLVPTRQRSR